VVNSSKDGYTPCAKYLIKNIYMAVCRPEFMRCRGFYKPLLADEKDPMSLSCSMETKLNPAQTVCNDVSEIDARHHSDFFFSTTMIIYLTKLVVLNLL
jgi:hypothetical protein